ncbi:unnamed protein product, partial [Nesidiocoris tenuis]
MGRSSGGPPEGRHRRQPEGRHRSRTREMPPLRRSARTRLSGSTIPLAPASAVLRSRS